MGWFLLGLGIVAVTALTVYFIISRPGLKAHKLNKIYLIMFGAVLVLFSTSFFGNDPTLGIMLGIIAGTIGLELCLLLKAFLNR